MSKTLHYPAILNMIAVSLILHAGVAGCSGTEHATESVKQQQDISEMEELYWARIDSSRMHFTQADVDFMTDMISHHAQALIMSRLAPKNNASRTIQTLAARIFNAQQDEIETMQTWLHDREQLVPEIQIEGLNLIVHGSEHEHSMHHHDMPGMLTQVQLEELAGLKGREFDRTFLTYMIEHHQGAVIMVDELFDTDGAALDEEAFRLASDIQAEQITEIERMKLMLENIE